MISLRDTIAEEEKQAGREKTLLAELKNIRANRGRADMNPNRKYPEAFRKYGLDLATTSLDQAITRLKTLPDALRHEAVTFLDDWASSYKGSEGEVLSPLALARGLDPNLDRNRLRSLLGKKDLKADADALRSMAKQANLVESGPATSLLLASALEKVGDRVTAEAVLREAVLRYPGDVWLNYELAGLCYGSGDGIRYLSIARALGASVGWYGQNFEDQRKYREAEAIYRDETKTNPTVVDFWYLLIDLLKRRGKIEEAREVREKWLAYVHKQIALAPNDAKPHFDAAVAYCELDDIPNLIAEFNEAARLAKQGRSAIYYSLGRELLLKDELKAAAKAFRDALQLDPEDVDCLYHLAFTLCRSGDHNGEVQALREALQHETKAGAREERSRKAVSESGSWHVINNIQDFLHLYEHGHRALASALAESGDLSGSMTAYRDSIRKNENGKSDRGSPYNSPLLAILLDDVPAEVIPELREAIRFKPILVTTPIGFHLALALARSGDLPAAIDLITKVCADMDTIDLIGPITMIDKKKDLIATFRRLRDAANDEKPVVQWIDRAIVLTERLMAMGSRLPKIYHQPYDPNRYLYELHGGHFSNQFPEGRFYAVGAELYPLVFDIEPDLLDKEPYYRLVAAGCAAKTGCGEAKDQPPLDDAARAKLRAQSLAWLRGIVAAEVNRQEKSNKANHGAVFNELCLSLRYSHFFSCVRYPAALAKLPEAERKAWEAFWDEFDELRSLWSKTR